MSRSTPARKNILAYLDLYPNACLTDIAKGSGVSLSSASRILRLLHIERKIHVSSIEGAPPQVRRYYSLGNAAGVERPPPAPEPVRTITAQQGYLQTEKIIRTARQHAQNPFGILIAQLAKSEVTG